MSYWQVLIIIAGESPDMGLSQLFQLVPVMRTPSLFSSGNSRCETSGFQFGNEDFFCPDKEIKELCGDVLLYVAQTRPMIDAVRAKKDRFRMETSLLYAGIE
jgi:hypothetical protein